MGVGGLCVVYFHRTNILSCISFKFSCKKYTRLSDGNASVVQKVKPTAIGLVRSRPASMKLHVTCFKGHGVRHHGTAVSW